MSCHISQVADCARTKLSLFVGRCGEVQMTMASENNHKTAVALILIFCGKFGYIYLKVDDFITRSEAVH